MDRDEKLKLDYEQTTTYYHHLADGRFKLLTLVPVVTGAAIGLLSAGTTPPTSVLAIGILGFLVTVGIFFYNQRNTQIFDAMILRAKMLEKLLQLELSDDGNQYAGPFSSRPGRNLKLFGVITIWADRGLAIIYGAVLGGWAFLITSSLLTIVVVSLSASIVINVGIPVVVALAFIWQVHKWDRATEKTPPNNNKLKERNAKAKRGS